MYPEDDSQMSGSERETFTRMFEGLTEEESAWAWDWLENATAEARTALYVVVRLRPEAEQSWFPHIRRLCPELWDASWPEAEAPEEIYEN